MGGLRRPFARRPRSHIRRSVFSASERSELSPPYIAQSPIAIVNRSGSNAAKTGFDLPRISEALEGNVTLLLRVQRPTSIEWEACVGLLQAAPAAFERVDR